MNTVENKLRPGLPIWLANQHENVSDSRPPDTCQWSLGAKTERPELHFHTDDFSSDLDGASVEGGQGLDTCLLIFSAEGGDSVSLTVTKKKKGKKTEESTAIHQSKVEIRTFY